MVAPSAITFDVKNTSGKAQYTLIKDYGMSTGTLDALRQNRSITMNTLNDICSLIGCDIKDVIEYTPDIK